MIFFAMNPPSISDCGLRMDYILGWRWYAKESKQSKESEESGIVEDLDG